MTYTTNTRYALPLAESSMRRRRSKRDRDRDANKIMIRTQTLHPDLLTNENNRFGNMFLPNVAPKPRIAKEIIAKYVSKCITGR